MSVTLAVLVLAGAAVLRGARQVHARRVAVPVVGTVALAAVSFKLDNIGDWRLAIFGLITLLVVYYLQDGIVGFVRQTLGWRGHGSSDAEAAATLPAPAAPCPPRWPRPPRRPRRTWSPPTRC